MLTLDDFPIPRSVQADPSWPPFLLEMADHIGAYHALVIIQHFGGSKVYIPADPECSPFKDIIPREAAIKLSRVYRRERLEISVGNAAVKAAKVEGLYAAIRAGQLSTINVARITRTTRRHVSRALNATDIGLHCDPTPLPKPRIYAVLREAASIAEEALRTAGAQPGLIGATTAKISDLLAKYHPRSDFHESDD